MVGSFIIVILLNDLLPIFLILDYLPFLIPSDSFGVSFQFWYFHERVIFSLFCLFEIHHLQEYFPGFQGLSCIFSSWDCVDYCVFFVFSIFQLKWGILYFQCPLCLSSIDNADILKICQIFVICDHLIDSLTFFQTSLPFFHRLDHRQHFFFQDNVILLSFVHLVWNEFNWSIFLWKYVRRHMIGRVGFNYDVGFWIKCSQQPSFFQTLFYFLERPFLLSPSTSIFDLSSSAISVVPFSLRSWIWIFNRSWRIQERLIFP